MEGLLTVVITGGTKGIGLAVAERLARSHQNIIVNYLQDEDAAARAISRIEALGARATAVRCDVGTPEGARQLALAISDVTSEIQVLVHCAVQVLVKPLLQADPVELTRAITTNGLSLVYVTQALLPTLKKGSSIIFLSSRGSRQVVPNYGAIGAGKALAESLIRYTVPELAAMGVRINAIAPGTLDTEAVRGLFGEGTDEYLRKEAEGNPSARNLRHDDYLGLVEFLSGPEAQMVQGQVIFVNGGQYQC